MLSMGNRPVELTAALDTLLRQRDVEIDVVVVGNGWQPEGLPGGVVPVHLPANVGVPGGRNVGAARARGDYLFFLDDDASLPTDDVLTRLVQVLERRPRAAIAQPRAVDPSGCPSPRRWVPRLRVGDPLREGVVAGVWEGAFLIRRDAFEGAGGWPESFFYAHEGIELLWRVYDGGFHAWYEPSIEVHHPATSPTRHAVYYRMNARNRVWVARRNLPAPLAALHVLIWVLLSVGRIRRVAPLRAWFDGFWEGVTVPSGPRRPMRWSTVLRLTRAGRPPVV